MRVAAGVVCWQDGRECLQATVDPLMAQLDRVFVADGAIDGYEQLDLPALTDLEWLEQRHPSVRIVRWDLWGGMSNKISALLDLARMHECEWLLVLAADEVLHDPAGTLRAYLDICPLDWWPLPFYYTADRAEVCPTKCLRVSAWEESVAGANAYRHANGVVYHVPEDTISDGCVTVRDVRSLLTGGRFPHLDHVPELRSTVNNRHELEYMHEGVPAGAQHWPDYPCRVSARL